MKENKAIRCCILGHSGIGKSPLTKLFKVDGWDPFRVRIPRNEQDAKVCKSPEEYSKLVAKYNNQKLIYESPQGSENNLRVFKDCSFFKVRGSDQYLEHTEDAKDENKSLRIEIAAPILAEMLENRENLKNVFALDPKNLMIILLNPTSQSFKEMEEPSPELRLATLFAITERSRIQSKGIDLADSLRRVEYLKDELAAWKKLYKIVPQNTVECQNWAYFEFRYSVPDATLSNAKVWLTKTRYSLLTTIEKQAKHLLNRVKRVVRTPNEIMELNEVI